MNWVSFGSIVFLTMIKDVSASELGPLTGGLSFHLKSTCHVMKGNIGCSTCSKDY